MTDGMKNDSSRSDSLDSFLNERDDFETNIKGANTNIEKGNWDDAYPYLKAAVEVNPGYVEGYNHLGIYYTRSKKYTEAINNFKKALQIDFAFTEAHYNLAFVYMERKEYNTALLYFKEVVLARPDDYETYHLMGLCCIHCNMEKEAEAFFSEAQRLKPDYMPPAINLCKLYIKKDDYAKAKNILLYALMNDSSVPEVHFLLGIIYKMQKKFPKAMHHFKETLLKDKNNIEAYNLLGECCVEFGLDKQAETFFLTAVRLDTSHINAFYNLGSLYYKQERYDDAIFYLEEYIKTKEVSDSVNAIWFETICANSEEAVLLYNLLGNCYKMIKSVVKARAIWEKSLAIQPQQPEIKDALSDLPQPLHKRISLVID